jgi:hypothetical protein
MGSIGFERAVIAYDAVDAALDKADALDVEGLSSVERMELLARREAWGRRVPAGEHALINELACASGEELGGTLRAVLADRLRIRRGEAARRVAEAADLGPRRALTGEPLAPRLEHTAAGQRAGRIGREHVGVIRGFLAGLPGFVDESTRAEAEQRLAAVAGSFRPDELERFAAHLEVVLNPDGTFSDADRARRRGLSLGPQGPDGMSSPVSSRGLLMLLQHGLEGSVFVGVVGTVGLPAAPDHVEPGTGEDAGGVRVIVAAGDGAIVEIGGPGIGSPGVAGEVADGVSQLFVAGPAKADRAHLSGLTGGGCHAGQAGQCLWSGESGSAVTDFSQKPCSADSSRSGQAGEDVRVGVDSKLLIDLLGEDLDLFHHGDQRGHQGAGDVDVCGAFITGGTARRGDQTSVHIGRIGAAGITHRGQPRAEALSSQPVGAVLAIKPGQELQTDRRVQMRKQADRPGKHPLEVLTQLVGQRHPMSDEVTAGSTHGAQRRRGLGVRDQGPQPGAVGPQRVGQHKGVEPIVLVAGRPVAAAQVLQLVGADHHHGYPRPQQGIDHRPVRTFNGRLSRSAAGQHRHQPPQPRSTVLNGASMHQRASLVDDRYRVIVTGPIDSTCQTVDRFRRQDRCGILHHSLLAASPSGEAPSSRCRGVTAGSLTVRRSTALSPVDGHHTPGNRRAPQNSSWTSKRQASRAMTRRHLRCIGDPSKITDTTMVHQ